MSEDPSTPLPPSPAEPPVDRPQSPVEIFRRDLWSATPIAWVTPLLLAANIVVFLLMVLGGAGLLDTNGTHLDKMIAWGAGFGPFTTHGQSWRLFTEMFVHFGILHIAMNMFVLWQVGPLTERLFGNIPFLVIYFLSGLSGSLLSLWAHPLAVAGGASGAIFGVYGALVGFLVIQRGAIPRAILRSLVSSALIFIVYNVIAGSTQSGIDMEAHLGGLISGLVLGMLLSRPLVRGAGVTRGVVVGMVGVVAVWWGIHRIPAVADLATELEYIDRTYNQAVQTFQDARARVLAGKINESDLVQIVQNQALEPVRKARQHVDDLQGVVKDTRQEKVWGLERTYAQQRQEQWEAILAGYRDHDAQKFTQANQLNHDAQQTMHDITDQH